MPLLSVRRPLPFSVPLGRAACICACLLLAACASFEGLGTSSTAIREVALTPPPGLTGTADAWPAEDWWSAYGDAQLDALIARALQSSPNLAAAQARIARAQAAAGLARSATGLQVNGALDASYGRLSENYQVPRPPLGKGGQYVSQGLAAVNFGYELDLWGKNAALIRSAEQQVRAAGFDRAAARLALTSGIVRAYAQLAAQHDLQDVLAATRKQRLAIRELTDKRVANGLDTNVEARQAQVSEASLRADLAQLDSAMQATRLQIAALAGDMPDAAQSIARPRLRPQPFTLPRSLPLDLLARRPELAAQRARIEAALGETEAAKAQFYPNVNLAALAGFQSIGLGQLFAAGSLMNSVGPSIRLPIFDSGRLRANFAARNADVDAAIAQYNQSVVSAAQDVAEQLTRVAALAPEEQAVNEALDAAQEAYRLATLRYRAGLTPYLTVLTVETQLLAQQRAQADLHARRLDLHASLIRALGGGFAEPAPAAAANDHQDKFIASRSHQ